MKVTGKICIALIVLVGVALAQSHVYRQIVRQVPDTTGYGWFTYDIYKMASPNDYLDKNSIGSGCAFSSTSQFMRWFADAGNFQHPWVDGDSVAIIGSWDPNPTEVGHTGYYFLFSDIMDAAVDPQNWSPDDTFHIFPKPAVSQIGPGDTVIVEIENPYETDHDPWGAAKPYDVLGFWVVMDSTGTGTPAAYDVELGFAPVDGVGGGSTFFKYFPGDVFPVGGDYDTYHAYYIVARPETTTTPGVIPGFSTPHMSQNSDPLVVSGIAEYNNEVSTYGLSARPSVFTENTQFSFTLPNAAPVGIAIYDAAGQLVSTVCDEIMPAGSHTVSFDGKALPSGVYFYSLQTDNEQLTGQIVKLH
jgi:hypothetical protein